MAGRAHVIVHAGKTVLDGIDWCAQLVTDRGEHDLHVLFHDELALKVLLCRHVCEHKDDLALGAEIVGLNPHIVVNTIEALISFRVDVRLVFIFFGTFLLLVIFLLLTG